MFELTFKLYFSPFSSFQPCIFKYLTKKPRYIPKDIFCGKKYKVDFGKKQTKKVFYPKMKILLQDIF